MGKLLLHENSDSVPPILLFNPIALLSLFSRSYMCLDVVRDMI